MTQITPRPVDPVAAANLAAGGLHPVLARLFASRGVLSSTECDTGLKALLAPSLLKGMGQAASVLADGITAGKRMLVIADYDCDGATACAVAVRGLRMLGANVSYLVPNRFEYGYGLTPEIVALAARQSDCLPDMLVTVDNGIASVDGVAAANALGIDVVVTDHHLPGDVLPLASAIVNPNQPGCDFPSKCMAGVGVMFYVLLALRAELRTRGTYREQPEPRLDSLLDLVALGTIADVVKLDQNNRILVMQGLSRIRSGQMQPGIAALFHAAARKANVATSQDLGFGLGPRLNAAGRLSDMSLGIECLTTDDVGRAYELAQQLDSMNRARRDIEAGMQQQAMDALDSVDCADRATVVLYDSSWHQGVIGIVAGRLKEKFHRPSITFASGDEHGTVCKGSGRSIPGFHLRDALDLVSKREPGLLQKFGGHAMAAGLTIASADLPRFKAAFEAVGREWLTPEILSRSMETDGDLESGYFTPEFIGMLEERVWGQGFPPPTFSSDFVVASQSLIKDKHLKLQLVRDGERFNAIWFNHAELLPHHVTVVYRLASDEWNGVRRVQLMVEHAA
ncbi:single-stranded-DNA-specific exonuclease RecJ [Paraburkholderia sp. BCC1886]|uniref:single-stranded-DNA-specific exonuclease RecJ n=1 Tax=Paraburkholderia sp. BCC1886 TaxID=2562670 RepID=UPI0011821832|nr:single-stranded-DNA-specific exonuclease RecJ [Paraburkholderia sp. BCC1886]